MSSSVHDYTAIARRVLSIEADALTRIAEQVDDSFGHAVTRILAAKGRLIVCGMGKSGHIGRKIAATMSSTGTPSYFMHPAEAFHGDLGMVAPSDVFLAVSHSGETEEILKLLPFLRSNGNPLIAMTGNDRSTLATSSNCHLNVAVSQEACPLNLAPTSSTTATLAMGDALAVALMQARGFQPENFAKFHPGGSLGKRLLSTVEDVMLTSPLPTIAPESGLVEILQRMSYGKLGLVIVQHAGEVLGVITDGDIRRSLEASVTHTLERRAIDLMNSSPLSVAMGTRMEDAWSIMDRQKVNTVLVMDNRKLKGVVTK